MRLRIALILLLINPILLIKVGFSQNASERSNQSDENSTKQGDWVYYYDEDWNTIENKKNASFYRLITYRDGRPIGQVADYFANGQMQMSIDSVITEEPLAYQGMLAEYSEEGNIVLVEFMNKGAMDTSACIRKFKALIEEYQMEIPEHLDLAYTANNLAYLYREQQLYDSSELYYRMAYDIRKKKLGSNHVIYGNSCNKLGYVLMKQEKLDEAAPLYEEAKRIHGATLGMGSDYYKNARNNLGYIYMNSGKFSLSLDQYNEALDDLQKSNEKNEKLIDYYTFQLARVYAKMEDWDSALEAYLTSKNITKITKDHMLWFVELME